jgi:uncharacterized RDD family membrane protein YckC
VTRVIRNERAEALQGGNAGFVSRVTADAIDFLVVQVIYFGVLVGVAVLRFLVTRRNFTVTAPDVLVTVIAQWTILVLYLGSSWSSTGRTIGKSVLGLRVSGLRGNTLRPVRAFTRALFCACFYPSLLWILVSRRNAALHDVVLRTEVLYDWHTKPTTVHSEALTADR